MISAANKMRAVTTNGVHAAVHAVFNCAVVFYDRLRLFLGEIESVQQPIPIQWPDQRTTSVLPPVSIQT